jgi:drug/metabolite transporter (DMT)-like permease
MKRRDFGPLELVLVLYFISYLPNIVLTKLATATPRAELGRPLTGLETLPSTLIMNMVLTYLFIWLSGWHRVAHGRQIGPVRVPLPTRYTFLSGIGTALVLCTVPLSYTLTDVSIPFIQLLMRGDILIIAPLVDLMFGRRVRWWSWSALVLVALALVLVVRQRGGFHLSPLAIATVVLYTAGYFLRLAVMTRVAKRGDADLVRKYFVEEKVIALPLSIVALALMSLAGLGSQANELSFGFLSVWSDPVFWPLAGAAVTLTIVSVFAAIILLDPHENSYCVPLERSTSLVAGLAAAFILYWGWSMPRPTNIEMLGSALLIAAIVLLTLAPRFRRRGAAAPR